MKFPWCPFRIQDVKSKLKNCSFFSPPAQKRPKLGLNDFDLERARHEVFNLGIKGFKTKDKKEAKIELAIRLGAIVSLDGISAILKLILTVFLFQ